MLRGIRGLLQPTLKLLFPPRNMGHILRTVTQWCRKDPLHVLRGTLISYSFLCSGAKLWHWEAFARFWSAAQIKLSKGAAIRIICLLSLMLLLRCIF